MADSYVCSGATMKCTMGDQSASLTVLPSRTVFLCGKPMANISDHAPMVNLAPFGKCRSLAYPATAAATAAHLGKLTPMPCVHNTPMPWAGGKSDYIIKGQPALLKSCKCTCMWGGMISLVDDGQINTGFVEMRKESRDEFTLTENNKTTEKYSKIINEKVESTDIDERVYPFGEVVEEKVERRKKVEASKLIEVLRMRMSHISPKTVEEMIKLLPPPEKKSGGNNIYRWYSGGWELASFIFDRLCLTNVDEIKTDFGKGRRGYDEKGRMVILRPGSKEGPVTIQVIKEAAKQSKTIVEVRFSAPIEELIEKMTLVCKDGDTEIYQTEGGKEQAILDFKRMGLEYDINNVKSIDNYGESVVWGKEVCVVDEKGNIVIYNPGSSESVPTIEKQEKGITTIVIRYVN